MFCVICKCEEGNKKEEAVYIIRGFSMCVRHADQWGDGGIDNLDSYAQS